ncbi:mth938 domain-containing protein-like [Glandiceps talaboti]
MVQKGGVIFGVSAVTCFSSGLLLWLFVIQSEVPFGNVDSSVVDFKDSNPSPLKQRDVTVLKDDQYQNTTNQTSAMISSFSWGSTTLGDGSSYKDFKIWPGGSRIWDWGETGTHHSPGVQIEDVQEIIEKDINVLVIGNGIQTRLEVPQETLDYVKRKDVEAIVMQSEKAVEKYNNLVQTAENRVGGIFHSTC